MIHNFLVHHMQCNMCTELVFGNNKVQSRRFECTLPNMPSFSVLYGKLSNRCECFWWYIAWSVEHCLYELLLREFLRKIHFFPLLVWNTFKTISYQPHIRLKKTLDISPWKIPDLMSLVFHSTYLSLSLCGSLISS